MSESSYNLRPRVKVRSRSETRSALSHDPSTVTRSAVTSTILTGEKGPVPGQHPVPEVVGSVVAPLPAPEMWSRQVFSLFCYIGQADMEITVLHRMTKTMILKMNTFATTGNIILLFIAGDVSSVV